MGNHSNPKFKSIASTMICSKNGGNDIEETGIVHEQSKNAQIFLKSKPMTFSFGL